MVSREFAYIKYSYSTRKHYYIVPLQRRCGEAWRFPPMQTISLFPVKNHKHGLYLNGDHREYTRNTEKHAQKARRSSKPFCSQSGQAEDRTHKIRVPAPSQLPLEPGGYLGDLQSRRSYTE